jgi:D-glycero-alpha-D-manno-heptose-7-phosphate kinase
MTRIRASAPVRLDFAGGWTDVAPFATEVGGTVVNAAIALCAEVEVEPGGRGWRIDAEDLGVSADIPRNGWTEVLSARLALHKAALCRSGLEAGELRTRSAVPPGSGLGSSGALGVALVAALDAASDRRRTPTELAELAFTIEAEDAGLPGGKQDQYAAALGGFQHLGFDRGAVSVKPLRLDPGFARRLEERIVICYTGRSRVSSDTISRVMGAYQSGDRTVGTALRGLAALAAPMAQALGAGDLAGVARLLSENWKWQQQLDPSMRSAEMARLETAMLEAGALGGKAAGAGAGGSMFFVAGDDVAAAVRAADSAGCRVIPFSWAAEGVRLS